MKRIILILAILAMALLLSACGGGSEAISLNFEGDDTFQFSPDSASVQAGEEVEVTFKNVGALDHTWTLVAQDLDLIHVRGLPAEPADKQVGQAIVIEVSRGELIRPRRPVPMD